MRKPTNTEVVLGIILFAISVTLGMTVYSNSIQQELLHSSLTLQKDYLSRLIQLDPSEHDKTFYQAQLNFTEWQLSAWEKTK